ncbi:MAG TPA: ATP-binding cassette domain-containing protein [Deltaproteobacteria bacterium]|nr:ATP-binding cassette domain-containing protein [Deltaproteobacteria bacterium]
MGEVEVKVLPGIDPEIRKGWLTVIVGASGAGKSTLLNIIGGIDRATSDEESEIKEGLKGGETIIVAPPKALRSGDRVKPS